MLLRKLLYLLTRRQKLAAGGLIIMMLVGAFLELAGIAAVLPFLALISSPQSLERHEMLRRLYEAVGASSPQSFLVYCGLALVLVYLGKNLYLAFMHYTKFGFVYAAQVSTAARLLDGYMRAPYVFHLRRNSAELLRNATTSVQAAFAQVLLPLLSAISELSVLVVVIALLWAVEPLATPGAILLLGGAGALFFRATRTRSLAAGAALHENAMLMNKWVNQGLGVVKEATILGRQSYFVDSFTAAGRSYAAAARFFRFMFELPRLFVETLGIGTILLITVVILAGRRETPDLVPLLGLFAMAANRLMPSMNRLLAALSTIRLNKPNVDQLYTDLRGLERAEAAGPAAGSGPPIVLREALEVRRLSYRHEDAAGDSLVDVSLTIRRGESVAFVGPSGAGKTTIVDAIMGLLRPQRGAVLVDGRDVREDIASWQRQFGYVPQPVYLCDDTIRRNVALGERDADIDDDEVWRALEAAQLADHVASLPEGLDTPVGEEGVRLSGGQRQRLGIARALYRDAEVLVLDEATSAVDAETERAIAVALERLRGRKTILFIAHRLTTVRDCDRVFFLLDGRLAASGTFDELQRSSADFRKMARLDDEEEPAGGREGSR